MVLAQCTDACDNPMTYELACELVLMMVYELVYELMVPMMDYYSIRNVSTDRAIVEGSIDGLHLDK